MDDQYAVNGDLFVWNQDKAQIIWRKHGVRVENSATVFSDRLFVLTDAPRNDKARDAAIGFDTQGRLLFWCTSKSRQLVSVSCLRSAQSSEKR
ncbi:MAG: BrnT family toxin [Chitinophagaceae bacterium]|nr:BrnT family toxin [Polaromonas sp.]